MSATGDEVRLFRGLRVAELGGGPAAACGAHFAQLGAWVLRIDAVKHASEPGSSDIPPSVNAGKHSIIVDPTKEGFDDVLDRLLDLAEFVVIDEQSPMWSHLVQRRDTLTNQRCLFLAAWGTHRRGIDLPSTEATQQASSGLWEYVGSPSSRHLVDGHLITQMSAMMGFIGLLAAQLGDMRGVDSSTLGTTTFMMTPLYAAESMMAEWRGHHLRGKYMPPLHGWRTRDGSIYFEFSDGDKLRHWAHKQRITVLDDLSDEEALDTVGTGAFAPSYAEAYEEVLSELTCEEALMSVRTAGGRATEILSYQDALRSTQAQANDLAATTDEDPTARIPISMSYGMLGSVPTSAWRPGGETREVLLACGYDERETSGLIERGVAIAR